MSHPNPNERIQVDVSILSVLLFVDLLSPVNNPWLYANRDGNNPITTPLTP